MSGCLVQRPFFALHASYKCRNDWARVFIEKGTSMSLSTCSDCGREISNRAPAYPNCGCPTQGTALPTVPPVSGRSSLTLVPPAVSPAGIPSLAASRSSRWHDPPIYRAAIGLIGVVAAWLLAEVIGSGYEPGNFINEGGVWLAALMVAIFFAVSLSVADYLIGKNWRRAVLGSIFPFGLAISQPTASTPRGNRTSPRRSPAG